MQHDDLTTWRATKQLQLQLRKFADWLGSGLGRVTSGHGPHGSVF